MLKQARAELDVDAVGGVREQIGSKDSQYGLENRDRHQPEHEDIERTQRAMHQHLVNHHLKEQWRDQAEQLQEERRDQNFAQEMSVFLDRRHEPGDVESARDIGQSGAAGYLDKLAVPDRYEFVARH